MPIAYFIGGPEDLVKRYLSDTRPFYTVAVLPPQETLCIDGGQVPPMMAFKTVQYKLVNRLYMDGETVIVYAHLP